MRISASEKMEIIQIVERSELGVKRTLQELKINRSTFYNWYAKYRRQGFDGLKDHYPGRKHYWNQIPDEIKELVVKVALNCPEKSSREVAAFYTEHYKYYVSESSVYRILKKRGLVAPAVFNIISAADEFEDKTTHVNQMWQTDFTYLKVKSWGWYYLSTLLDDYSRYIVTWKLCKTMKERDVEATIDQALFKHSIPREQRPTLLSDNGSCYIANGLKTYLNRLGLNHIRGAANHPQTQGKIERYHRSMKSVLMLENYFSPEELERKIAHWVNYYNNQRYHEAINNLTPADMFFGRDKQKLQERETIKRLTMIKRKRDYKLKILSS